MIRFLIATVLTFPFLISCSSVAPTDRLNPDLIYKRDMIINIDGVVREGVMVVPEKMKHSLYITAQGDLDLFTLTTCHREEASENAWNVSERGLFRRKIDKKREIKIEYIATDIERKGGCPIFLGGYEQEKGRHSWGVIDFETSEAKLPAILRCNGETISSNGVSICQSREGLIQSIEFQTETRVIPDKDCSIGSDKGTTFTFALKKGQCVYAFQEVSTKKIHRLTTIGYELIPIRK